jgi:transposase
LKDEVAEMGRKLSERDRQLEALNQELQLALQTINMMRHRMFGRSSEQMNPGQGQFDNLLDECDSINGETPEEKSETEKIEYERRKGKDNRNGRLKIPDHLERVEKFIDLPESEKICPVTGLPMIKIGEEISEQLAYEPGRLYAIRYIRPKYVSPDRRNGNSVGVKTAPLPEGPIDRCKADVSLLAHIIVSKFCDHQPLYRQRGILARHGMPLPESTMGDWTRNVANALEPLARLAKETVLASDYINADDTYILFVNRKKAGKGKKKAKKNKGARKGHMWAYLCHINDPPDEGGKSRKNKLVFFEFTEDWKEEHPLRVLKDFKGNLQSDAYVGFKKVCDKKDEITGKKLDDIIGLGCWSHARRKYFLASEIGVKEAEYFVMLINILYRIEHRIADLEERGCSEEYLSYLRKKRANRVMDRFFEKVKTTTLLPQTPLGKALTYSRNQEQELRRYVEELRFRPDNNVVEQVLRTIGLGRKNYVFLGSECGGKTAAILYTLICSSKANGIDPYEYLKDILARINSHPHSKLHELLPHNWERLRKQMQK